MRGKFVISFKQKKQQADKHLDTEPADEAEQHRSRLANFGSQLHLKDIDKKHHFAEVDPNFEY
jgi:hypothetical protein